MYDYVTHKRLELQMACYYKAAHSGFKYLPIYFVINPPKQLFEATLARRIAIHLMRTVFNIPCRRIASALNRQRITISFKIPKIIQRLQEPCFACEINKLAEAA